MNLGWAATGDEAEQPLRDALTVKEHVLGPDHPEVAATLDNDAGLATLRLHSRHHCDRRTAHGNPPQLPQRSRQDR